ncbi:MAG: Ig-like domain-containing protein [Ruminococcaceae bacterium]|nr:Ig-like domain-containing protein [Oscillospiraceae bacterium]
MKRVVSLFLALLLCLSLLPVGTLAADNVYVCRLKSTGVTASLTHYIEYEWCGKTYRSDSTGAIANFAAWQNMSDADKRKVTKWFAGFSSQMEAQFSGASDMREFAMANSGWQQAGEALRDRLASTYYPDLKAFYEGDHSVGNYLLDSETRSRLTAAELDAFDEAANTYGVAYSLGQDAYQKLLNLKQKQVNAAVTAISSELIDLIMKYSMPPRPGEVMDTLEDTLKDYIKDSIGIEDKIKDLVGISKLTGEADRIETDKAAKVIELFWELMGVQQRMAFNCMMKCQQMESTLTQLSASCASTASKRTASLAAAEAKRQQEYEAAVNANVAQSDIDPKISVTRNQNETQESYDARRLSAAKTWATAEFDKVEADMDQLWSGGYDPSKYSPAELNRSKWLEWSNSPSAFYTRCFKTYLNKLDSNAGNASGTSTLNSCSVIMLNSPENLFKYYTGYDAWLETVYAGYDAALSALTQIESEINAYIDEKDRAAVNFRTAATPYRNRGWNLTASHCTWSDEGYGNWGVSDSLWTNLQSTFSQRCAALRVSEDVYNMLESVRAEKNRVSQYKAEYERMQEGFEASLPELYELYAYSQDELDYSLSLAMRTIESLKTLQASYPDWIKNAKTGYSPIGAGQVAAASGTTNEPLETTVFKGVSSISARYEIMENQLVPQLLDYRQRESELLATLDKAKQLFQAAADKRNADDGALYGQAAELANLNARQLGSMTIQNHVDMMKSYGFYDYYYGLNGKSLPKKTTAIEPLLADLSGDSPYMVKIRALHAELLEKKGDYLRQAQAGTLRSTSAFDDRYHKNGSVSSYTTGIYGDAFFRSYTYWSVWNYWYENIRPIIEELDDVLYHNITYVPVTSLSKGGAQLAESGGAAADLTLELGQSGRLSVTVKPANATYPELVWRSSDETVATVDQNGVVTSLLPGSATITATAADSPSESRITASFSVRVTSNGYSSLSQLGDGYFLLAPSVKRSGKVVTVNALLGTNGTAGLGNGNEFLYARAIFAVYQSGRFLGATAVDCIPYRGELTELSASITLSAAPSEAVTVKLFLLEHDSLCPAMGYEPITLSG